LRPAGRLRNRANPNRTGCHIWTKNIFRKSPPLSNLLTRRNFRAKNSAGIQLLFRVFIRVLFFLPLRARFRIAMLNVFRAQESANGIETGRLRHTQDVGTIGSRVRACVARATCVCPRCRASSASRWRTCLSGVEMRDRREAPE
jgi:hypothetical protein